MNTTIRIYVFIVALFISQPGAWACTNYLITKGASKNGSVMISYAADSHTLFGELYHWPAQKWSAGSTLKVYEWDTGKYMGEIKQAKETYNVVGNVNEYQVAVGETTFGGHTELIDTSAIIDYGSLIYLTLQRSKSAREAIKIMTDLVAEYGYASSGESFSVADPNEAWIIEMIGKGPGNTGAVWVARMIPDGYVSGHANQARITTFPQKDKSTISSKQISKIFDKNVTTVYADDVITFARNQGYFSGKDADFSFSDTYAPVDFEAARFCEIRVWSMFTQVASGMDKYWNYAKGNIEHAQKLESGNPNTDGYATNRMPLWIKPDHLISNLDMFHFMRNHLEGTELDMSQDIGAGPYGNPYRWRPLTWEVDGKEYCNERATATQQTGFSFVAELRSAMPRQIGGINWFGVDDAASTVYMPMYTSITKIPHELEQGNGAIMEWSDDAAFWVFSQVSNFAYTRYNLIHPEIAEKQKALEEAYVAEVEGVDKKAQELLKESDDRAIAFLTDYSASVANKTVTEWKGFYHYLFMKYMDGNVKEKQAVPDGYKYVEPKLDQPGYGERWYKNVVNETGDQFLMPAGETH